MPTGYRRRVLLERAPPDNLLVGYRAKVNAGNCIWALARPRLAGRAGAMRLVGWLTNVTARHVRRSNCAGKRSATALAGLANQVVFMDRPSCTLAGA
jgi:hypothetical protein